MLGLSNSLQTSVYIAGGPPYSLKLDGSSDHGRAEHHSSLKPTDAITISCWINIDAEHGGSGWGFINSGGNQDHEQTVIGSKKVGGWDIRVTYAGTENNPVVKIKSSIRVSNNNIGATDEGYLEVLWGGVVSSTNPDTALHEIKDFSGWVHLALTYTTSGVASLYINGNKDLNEGDVDTSATQTTTGVNGATIVYNHDTKVFIGADAIGLGDNPQNGLIGGLVDDYAIWSSALSDAAILSIYNNKHAGFNLASASGNYSSQASLQAWWRFEEGEGTTVADSSSNNHVVTLVNSPSWSDNTSEL